MNTKSCVRCQVAKPHSDFNRCAKNKDGLNGRCRDCDKEYKAKWKESNIEKCREYGRRWARNNTDKAKLRYEENKEAFKARRKEKYWKNPEAARQYSREWAAANKDKRAEYNRNNITALREKRAEYRKRNINRIREYMRDYCRSDKFRGRYYHMVRRARKLGAPGHATKHQISERWNYYGGLCWMCRAAPAETVDHVIPLSRGGSNWPANLRPACKSCNSHKNSNRWDVVVPLIRIKQAEPSDKVNFDVIVMSLRFVIGSLIQDGCIAEANYVKSTWLPEALLMRRKQREAEGRGIDAGYIKSVVLPPLIALRKG